MLDLKNVRERLDQYKADLKKRHSTVHVEEILALDDQRKALQQQIDSLKFQQKTLASQQDYEAAKALKTDIQAQESEYETLIKKLHPLLLQMPNFLSSRVPTGKDETENVEIRRVGEVPTFDFSIQDHMSLMKKYDMVDFERGAKIAGTRSYFLKNDGMLLEQAVQQYALQKMIKKGFQPFIVPNIVNTECLVGTGWFPGGEEDAYRLERDDQWLIATAEIPLTSYHTGDILREDELPKKYVGLSPCYRREAGSYGKDTAGLYRVHQFTKLEQVVILPEDVAMSDQFHAQILANAEELLVDLGIPYRVLQLCAGDLAIGKYDSHDIECRMPSRNAYGETHSATSFLDFQARRLNLRYRDSEGNVKYCYTMNNTVVATPRILIAIIENNQTAD
ncbi:MAG: serine--tRNA ligase [Candidatus Peribacteria bacterium]|jgi:seryl-tRNA synthetase|nr:serine--tRNA ligase [Candidatus Peribacteria bacterium]